MSEVPLYVYSGKMYYAEWIRLQEEITLVSAPSAHSVPVDIFHSREFPTGQTRALPLATE